MDKEIGIIINILTFWGFIIILICFAVFLIPNVMDTSQAHNQAATAVQTAATPLTITTTPVINNTPTKITYSINDIKKHFIDITFDLNNTVISKKGSRLVKISSNMAFNDSDTKAFGKFTQQFNNYSDTVKLPSEVQTLGNADLIFTFLPGASLDTLAHRDSRTDYFLKIQDTIENDSGTIYLIYGTISKGNSNSSVVYINSDLPGNKRAIYLIRGLLEYLGFFGETSTYPDSIFYYKETNTTLPNEIDWIAIKLMYGNQITNGMDINAIRNSL